MACGLRVAFGALSVKIFNVCNYSEEKRALSLSFFIPISLLLSLLPHFLCLSRMCTFLSCTDLCALVFLCTFDRAAPQSPVSLLPVSTFLFLSSLSCPACPALPLVRQQLSKLMSSIRWHLLLLLLPLLFHDKCFCLP